MTVSLGRVPAAVASLRSGRRAPSPLPSGSVTLLFTDIEGSTRLLERLGERFSALLDQHHRIIRAAIAAHDGHEIRTAGDAFFVVFTRPHDAVRAVVAAQRAFASAAWPDEPVRVRMALHTGQPRVAGDDYVGIDVHRAARICSAAHGAQVVISETTASALAREPITGVGLRDLGEHRLKDLSRPLRLHQLVADGLVYRFPRLRTLADRATPHRCTTSTSPLRLTSRPVATVRPLAVLAAVPATAPERRPGRSRRAVSDPGRGARAA